VKKIASILLVVFLAVSSAYTQDQNPEHDEDQNNEQKKDKNFELTFSGEVKTGFFAEHERIGDIEPRNYNTMGNTDGDSGSDNSRLRLDIHAGYGNVGLQVRFQVEAGAGGAFNPAFNYAYAYGNLFKDQFTISAGILGNSPWSSGGPYIRQELETRESIIRNPNNGDITTFTSGLIGIRFEYKPNFYPKKYGRLNIGFVLNQTDGFPVKTPSEQTFVELLGETVLGISYQHDYFAASFAYRFDSEMDKFSGTKTNEGGRLTYRLEERALDKVAKGMQISLNGYYYGIGMEQFDQDIGSGEKIPMGGGEYFVNWLYWLWDHKNFIAKFDLGFTMYKDRFNQSFVPQLRQEYQILEILPAFYYKFLDNFLQVGLGLGLGIEFGSGNTFNDSLRILGVQGNKDLFYQYIFVEPQIRLNFNSGAYVALLYNFTHRYAHPNINIITAGEIMKPGDMSFRHWINLRAVYSF